MQSKTCSAIRFNRKLIAAAISSVAFFSGSTALAQAVTGTPDQTVQRNCADFCVQGSENIAVDGAGNAFAIWVEYSENPARTVVSRYNVTANQWSTPVALSSSLIRTLDADVGVDSKGNALAVWSVFEEGVRGVQYAIYSVDTNTWSGPMTALDRDAITGVLELQMSENGDATVLLFGERSLDARIIRFDAATRIWSPAEGAISNVKLDVDPAGNAIFVTGTAFGSGGLTARRYNATTKTYSGTTVIEAQQEQRNEFGVPITQTSFTPLATSLDTFGNVMVVYSKVVEYFDGTEPIIETKTARYAVSRGVWLQKAIPFPKGQYIRFIDIDDDRFGNAHLVWNQYVGPYSKPLASKYSSTTGQWSTPTVLSSGSFNTRDVSLDANPNGDVIATWSQRTDTGTGSALDKIFKTTAARYQLSPNTWGAPSNIQDVNRNGYRPFMGVDNSGRAVVIWNQDSWRVIDGQRIKVIRADRVLPK